jgi:hypothetical protein
VSAYILTPSAARIYLTFVQRLSSFPRFSLLRAVLTFLPRRRAPNAHTSRLWPSGLLLCVARVRLSSWQGSFRRHTPIFPSANPARLSIVWGICIFIHGERIPHIAFHASITLFPSSSPTHPCFVPVDRSSGSHPSPLFYFPLLFCMLTLNPELGMRHTTRHTICIRPFPSLPKRSAVYI